MAEVRNPDSWGVLPR